MDDRIVAWDMMGTVFDVTPVEERFGKTAMPRLLQAATSLQLLGSFVPFPEIVEAVLGEEALEVFARLDAYADAAPALDVLERAGIRSVALTNGSRQNTVALLERAGLTPRFAGVVSVDEVRTYKPAPEPYRHVGPRFGLVPEQVILIAAHGWDAAGARAAGLRAIWVDREEGSWQLPLPEAERARNLVAAAEAAAA